MQVPTYNLFKFLVPKLNTLTKTEYTVKDSLHFAEEICEQDTTLSTGSLGVYSLFTNIPLETIDIRINQLTRILLKGYTVRTQTTAMFDNNEVLFRI